MQVSVYQILIDSLTPKIMIDKFLYSQNNLVSDSVPIQFFFFFCSCSPCSCSCSYSEFCSYDSSCSSFGTVVPVSCFGSVSCSISYYGFSGFDFLFQFLQRFFFYCYSSFCYGSNSYFSYFSVSCSNSYSSSYLVLILILILVLFCFLFQFLL